MPLGKGETSTNHQFFAIHARFRGYINLCVCKLMDIWWKPILARGHCSFTVSTHTLLYWMICAPWGVFTWGLTITHKIHFEKKTNTKSKTHILKNLPKAPHHCCNSWWEVAKNLWQCSRSSPWESFRANKNDGKNCQLAVGVREKNKSVGSMVLRAKHGFCLGLQM